MANEIKTHWKKLYNPDYLGAYSLMQGDKPTEMDVTISKVILEKVAGADGKKEDCTVCQLVGQKPMVLNATNQKLMEKIFGSPYIEDWAGKKMTLCVKRIRAFGETVDALRVKDSLPKQNGTTATKEELTPTHPKWHGAKEAIASESTTIEKIKVVYILSPENEELLTAKSE